MRYLARNASTLSLLKSKLQSSSFFSYFTKFSSSSYWFFACSATSDVIFFSEKSLSARALKRMLLCSGCPIVFIGAKHEAFLARQKFMGDFLRNSRTRSNPSCLHRPLNFFFLSAETVLFLKDLWWLPEGPLTHPLNGFFVQLLLV